MASSRRAGTNESKWTVPGGAGTWAAGVNTFAASGADYSAITLWETDTDVDIVTATVSPVLECAAGVYTVTAVSIGGATTSASYFRILRAASNARHGGVSGAGVKLTQSNYIAGARWIAIGETFSSIEDLECACAANSTGTGNVAVIGLEQASARAVGLLVTGTQASTGEFHGIVLPFNYANRVVANCIVYGCKNNGIAVTATGTAAGNRIVNCTVTGCGGYGYTYAATTAKALWKNNIAQDNTGGDFNGAGDTGTDYNLSKDTSAPGANSVVSTDLTFNNAAANDYRLAGTDTAAIGAGVSLASDTWAFDDDIAFTTRGAAWDIGAHEYVSAAAAFIPAARRFSARTLGV